VRRKYFIVLQGYIELLQVWGCKILEIIVIVNVGHIVLSLYIPSCIDLHESIPSRSVFLSSS